MKRLLTFLWLIGLTVSGAVAQIEPEVGPLNPEYLRYLKMVDQRILPPSQDSLWFGGIPEPILPNFDAYYQTKTRAPQAFPSRFDLREEGRVTSVKNQGACGSCWVFGTFGALESSLLTRGFGTLDLSEDNVMQCGTNTSACVGGWISTVVAYLATGEGPVSEEDDPYTARTEGDCPIELPSPAYVANVRYLPPDADLIKQTITNIGGIAINMPWGWSNYNRDDYTYFGSAIDNYHCVAIIGWDDNKPTKGGKGAWIAKNSWGRFWGEEGYFYIAYQQPRLSIHTVFENGIEREPGAQIYYYDKAGLTRNWGLGQDSGYGLTKFEASSDQTITRVGTFVMASRGTINIEIYDEFNNILLGSLYNQSYDLPGYYTFDLPTPIDIEAGDDFFVKVKYQTPQFNYPIPSDYKAPVETNKCWISHDGESWIAMGKGTSYVADLTIKAYTVPQSKSLEVESLTLVNTETNLDIRELRNGDVVNLAETGNIEFTVRANTSPSEVNRVEFELTGSLTHSQNERKLPYALFGDEEGGDYYGELFPAGEYTLTATPFTRTQRGTPLSITFQVVDKLSIKSLILVDAETDQSIQELKDRDIISLYSTDYTSFSVQANTYPETVNQVEFELTGPSIHSQRERKLPYTLFGDDMQGDYYGEFLPAGQYSLTVIPFSQTQRGTPIFITFQVVDELQVASLTLVNAHINQDIQELQNGDVINLAETGNVPFSVRANTSPETMNFVRFELSGPTIAHSQREGKPPYALYGDDTEGSYFGQRWGTGNYTLTVTPFSQNQRGQILTTDFEVVWNTSSSSSVAFQVYPIPTKGEVQVVHNPNALQLHVLDRVGNILLSQPLSSATKEVVNLQAFGQGTYYLKLISPQMVEMKRVVVE